MKKLTLTLLAAAGLLLFSTANSNAGVHFGIFVGPPAPVYCPPQPVYYGGYCPDYGYGYGYYGYRPHYRYYHSYRGGYGAYHRWHR